MRWFMSLFLALGTAILVFPGCTKPSSEDTGKSDNVAAHVVRGKEKRNVENELRNIGQLFAVYHTNLGGARPDMEAFKAQLQKDDPKSFQGLKEGRYVLRPIRELSSNLVLAYEKDPDLRGMHVVVFGDATVRTLNEQDLQAALKNR